MTDHRTLAFLDELEKISGGPIDAAIHGGAVKAWNWTKAFPGRALRYAKNVPVQLGQAGAAFTTPVESLKRGVRYTWAPHTIPGSSAKPLHPAMKALMGLSLIQGGYDTIKPNDPQHLGRSRLHRGLQFAGQQAGGYITAPFGLAGGMLGSYVGDRVGATAGSVVDRIRGYRPPTAPPPNLPPRPQGMNDQVP